MYILLIVVVSSLIKYSEQEDVKIHERNAHFMQEIKFTKDRKCMDFKTPPHNGRLGVALRQCPEWKQKAQYSTDPLQPRMCLIFEDLSEGSSNELKRDFTILLRQGVPDTTDVVIEDTALFPTSVQDIRAVDPSLVEFCGDRQLMWGSREIKLEDAKKTFLIEMLAPAPAPSNSRNKKEIIKSFMACDASSVDKIKLCAISGKEPYAECKFRSKQCTYKIICPMKYDLNGFDCKPNHVMNSVICCDFMC
ncbi:uncharacterized protein LOC100204023 isoform X1 [Hydra vulgaris]|uniref:uncharacterized protein LOC100204023 isoform X1 n=1 Tax=Hydra vulgaris TaxID=6087 RepID=UPI0001926D9F|nr:uncharacterized protein LOC100204023 isoform X1 [Hydra vulgaris]